MPGLLFKIKVPPQKHEEGVNAILYTVVIGTNSNYVSSYESSLRVERVG
jgi:hypothetical protein